MKEEQQISVQSALGMMAQGMSALFPEKVKDTRTVTMLFSEYEKLVKEASNTHKDAKIKEMQSQIHELNREIFDWQTRYAKLDQGVESLVNENINLRRKVAWQDSEIYKLKNKRKWWQIWKR